MFEARLIKNFSLRPSKLSERNLSKYDSTKHIDSGNKKKCKGFYID